ncbi:hypothetical protein [Flagellimonas sp. CMM7]|uniref:hypothetical protein n=1 Tax=Flagellimonas sp. CMM7 TaxID=2654676 RepID=UPI0013D04312|nr:hypothetical protein [Flagellimonas sp. CMM7]UII78470.1 hypothetical protein LV704_12445 [Flagellimonas sp. CMM7]
MNVWNSSCHTYGVKPLFHFPVKKLYRKLQRFASIVLVSFMLGISNVILEEDRMINDSYNKVELQETQDEDENL